MPRRIAIIAAVAGALFGVPEAGEARPSNRHLRFASAPVTVTSPLFTEPLRAGETILLAWEALPELGRHEGLEEWEAFLSLDDGGRYPVRVTPHLDIDQRSFAVTLPQFAATRARLLLRFGDEVRRVRVRATRRIRDSNRATADLRARRARPRPRRAGAARRPLRSWRRDLGRRKPPGDSRRRLSQRRTEATKSARSSLPCGSACAPPLPLPHRRSSRRPSLPPIPLSVFSLQRPRALRRRSASRRHRAPPPHLPPERVKPDRSRQR